MIKRAWVTWWREAEVSHLLRNPYRVWCWPPEVWCLQNDTLFKTVILFNASNALRVGIYSPFLFIFHRMERICFRWKCTRTQHIKQYVFTGVWKIRNATSILIRSVSDGSRQKGEWYSYENGTHTHTRTRTYRNKQPHMNTFICVQYKKTIYQLLYILFQTFLQLNIIRGKSNETLGLFSDCSFFQPKACGLKISLRSDRHPWIKTVYNVWQ